LAERFHDVQASCVVAPALGGIIIGYEVARALGVRSLFAERDGSGHMTLRRGFELKPGERVVVIEDVWTTGGSTRETISVVEEAGGVVVGAGAIVDRSGGNTDLNVFTRALLELDVPNYDPADCPLCRTGSAAIKPGSRFMRQAT
jgi:orotate phosphoribosyltransferase